MRLTLMGKIALAFASPRLALSGYVMTDSSIRTAVDAWLSNPTAAEATYGHISTWETRRVTDMEELFCASASCDSYNWGADSFNEDIGAWDTSGVTSMGWMFVRASAFNQDISAWTVDRVTSMERMFDYASAFNQDISDWAVDRVTSMNMMFSQAGAFDQDLGWCVDDGVDLTGASYNSGCWSTSCGILNKAALACGGGAMSDSSIRMAVSAWHTNAATAEARYGHISKWDTSRVRDMGYLFYQNHWKWPEFNEDISAWDTSSATTFTYMFFSASSFNQPIGRWSVDKLTSMTDMFQEAKAFNQDLGWCLGDHVKLAEKTTFKKTKCESTQCGVAQKDEFGTCDPGTRAGYIILIVLLLLLVLLTGAGAYVHRRKKEDETYVAAARRLLCCLCYRNETDSPAEAPLTPTTAFLKSLETRSPAKPETRAAAKAKFAPPFQRPGFTRKLSSFLFGEQEEATAPSAEQPPTRRTEPEPPAPKFEEMYNQIAAWYNQPENAALRARWGAYPEPEEFQTWPGFVRVTNAFLDASPSEP